MSDETTPRRPRILIIDDEAQILSALRRTLRREGYEIVTAETAGQALRELQSGAVDLVLSDHKMPGMSGVELMGRVAVLQPTAAKVMISGWGGALLDPELDALGVSALIPKPWNDTDLKRVLRSALAARS